MKKLTAFLLLPFYFLLFTYYFCLTAQAGQWTANGYLYKPSLGASGQTDYNLFNQGLDQADARLAALGLISPTAPLTYNAATGVVALPQASATVNGYLASGDWSAFNAKQTYLSYTIGDPGCATLAAALTTIGSTAATLRLPAATYNIASNTTIPANITLAPERGAVLSTGTGVTLALNGPFEAGLYQVFSCTGTGNVHCAPSAVTTISPLWWFSGTPGTYSESGGSLTTPGTGDIAPAIRAAVTSKANGLISEGSTNCRGADVVIPSGAWPLATSLNLTNLGNFKLHGSEKYSAILYSTATGQAAIDVVGTNNYMFEDFTVAGDSVYTPTVGLLGGRSTTVDNGGDYTFSRIKYGGYFQYGCEYTVAVEDIYENDCRCFLSSSGFYHRRSPQNKLGLTSAYVTLSTAFGGDGTAAWFKNFQLSGTPPNVTLQPFIIDGPSYGGFSGDTYIQGGYIACITAGPANQVVLINDGAEDVHLADVDIVGNPQTIVRVIQTDSTQRDIYNLTVRDIKGVGIAYPIMGDIYSNLYNCYFGKLLIGDTVNGVTNFSVLGNLFGSHLDYGWWGYYQAGRVTIGNTTNGAWVNGCELVIPSGMTLTLPSGQGSNFIQRIGGATPSYQLGPIGAAVNTPSVPASTVQTQNLNAVPCRVTISTVVGTVSAIAKGPTSGSLVTTNVTIGNYGSATLILQPGEYISMTYSGTAPTWTWVGM